MMLRIDDGIAINVDALSYVALRDAPDVGQWLEFYMRAKPQSPYHSGMLKVYVSDVTPEARAWLTDLGFSLDAPAETGAPDHE